jgi:hypothetical protein
MPPCPPMVAVGTAVARRPPHGSRRAELPHRALALDQTRESYLSPVAHRIMLQVFKAALRRPLLGSVSDQPGSPSGTLFGQAPSLHPLRRQQRAAVVRGLRGYYGPVRLPAAVHRRRVLVGSRRGPVPWRRSEAGSPGFRQGNRCFPSRGACVRAWGLRPRGTRAALA